MALCDTIEQTAQARFLSSSSPSGPALPLVARACEIVEMMRTYLFPALTIAACACEQVAAQTANASQIAAYTVPPGFPESLFPAYYIPPSPTQQPQPVIYDEVLNYTFPLELTDPATIPEEGEDPVYFPEPIGTFSNGTAIITEARDQLETILAGDRSNCTKCVAALEVGQYVAQRVPKMVPEMLVSLCQETHYMSNESCEVEYTAGDFGAIWTQVLALANMTEDGHAICNRLNSTWCPRPYTIPSDTSAFFGPKPDNVTVPAASGELVKVWHGSDFHIDPRYLMGSEANCTGGSGLCCRPQGNPKSGKITIPATLYGEYKCDSPYFLIASALQSIGPLTGTTYNNRSESEQFAWSIFTGDLASHEDQNELSRNYTMYAETAVYSMIKHFIPSGPVFVTLGNHDTNPEAIDSPHSLPGALGQQQSWNFDHVAALWKHNNWISDEAARQARMHYGGYSINHPKYPKLRTISLNSDFWYRNNYLNFINTTNPDNSGILKFLADELLAAEEAHERVWVMAHVLTGWDGTNPLPNPTDLFYQIIDRFSPHVIAGVFFGHTHEDELMVFYANNGTDQNANTAQTVGWIGPSLTPLTNVNPGYRMYKVDTGDFQIYDAYTYYTSVSSNRELDPASTGPVFELEYSTRDTYGPNVDWPSAAPLNATFWHLVSEQIEKNTTLASIQNMYQGRMSVKTPNCTNTACAEARACYMRSGSVALGRSCPQGYGSVQSPFSPKS